MLPHARPPLRLTLLTQSYPPMVSGAALVVQRLAEGLAARGHAVQVIAASERGPAYAVEGGPQQVSQVRLPALPNPLRAQQRFVLWPRGLVQRALQAFQPQLVHLHDPTTLGLLGLRAARSLRLPVVLTLHQLPWFVSAYLPDVPRLGQATERAVWQYFRWWLKQCQAAVTPSATIAGLIEAETGLRPQAITNGVDSARFNPQPAAPGEGERLLQRYGLRPGLPIILYAGRVDADKQVDLVVRAAARAMRSAPAQLLVAGDGKERAAVAALADSLGIGPFSRFAGFVSASGDLPGLYRLASVFATASEVEIQSSVVLEAAASGLPVVVVRASSMPEFVQDGVNGYLVPPRDVEAMAARLAELLQDPARARLMGQAGRRLAEAHSPQASVAAHETLYAAVIGAWWQDIGSSRPSRASRLALK